MRGPLSVRIWRAGTWKHGAPCHAAFHWAMSTKAVSVTYSAHQDGVAGLPTITHGLCFVLIRRSCSRGYSLARTISRQKCGNGELKGHGASRGSMGRGCSLDEAHVAFGINGQDSTELSRDIISFFFFFSPRPGISGHCAGGPCGMDMEAMKQKLVECSVETRVVMPAAACVPKPVACGTTTPCLSIGWQASATSPTASTNQRSSPVALRRCSWPLGWHRDTNCRCNVIACSRIIFL